jgi:hypothetical protein
MYLPNNAAGRFHLACPAWLLKNDTPRHLAIRIGRVSVQLVKIRVMPPLEMPSRGQE